MIQEKNQVERIIVLHNIFNYCLYLCRFFCCDLNCFQKEFSCCPISIKLFVIFNNSTTYAFMSCSYLKVWLWRYKSQYEILEDNIYLLQMCRLSSVLAFLLDRTVKCQPDRPSGSCLRPFISANKFGKVLYTLDT